MLSEGPEAHKQIVLVCDCPACDIKGIQSRLVSRFEWGLVEDLRPPDFATRLAILRKKAEVMRPKLPDDVPKSSPKE